MTNSGRRLFNIILALLVSIGAWMFVVYNYYPMTDVKYSGVPLSYEGQRDLAQRGLAVSEASTKGISVKLNQRRINYNNISAADIHVTANVSECLAGENDVSLNVSGPRDTTVVSYDTDTIKVMVERTDSSYLDIDAVYAGQSSVDELPIVIDIDRTSAEVVCASSKIDSIKKVAAVLNRNEVDDNVRSFTVRLAALDADGEIVPYAVIYPEEVSLDAVAGTVRTVKISAQVTGGSDEDYTRSYTATQEVAVKGPTSVLSKLDTISAEVINIDRYYEDSEVELGLDLPEGVTLVDPDKPPLLQIKVTKIEKPETTDEETSTDDEEATD